MFDPEARSSERNAEWFEGVNAGPAAAGMTGWTIVGGDLKTNTITSLVVAPGGRAVLASNGDQTANGGVHADYVYGAGVPLYNSKGRLVLKSASGAIID